MPAAAVIPAPIVYIKVVAVKKLVVGFRSGQAGPPRGEYWPPLFLSESLSAFCCSGQGIRDVYFEKIRVFKAGDCLNTLAWNNGIGPRSYFVGFQDRSND